MSDIYGLVIHGTDHPPPRKLSDEPPTNVFQAFIDGTTHFCPREEFSIRTSPCSSPLPRPPDHVDTPLRSPELTPPTPTKLILGKAQTDRRERREPRHRTCPTTQTIHTTVQGVVLPIRMLLLISMQCSNVPFRTNSPRRQDEMKLE